MYKKVSKSHFKVLRILLYVLRKFHTLFIITSHYLRLFDRTNNSLYPFVYRSSGKILEQLNQISDLDFCGLYIPSRWTLFIATQFSKYGRSMVAFRIW
jgi:hypothetical protein